MSSAGNAKHACLAFFKHVNMPANKGRYFMLRIVRVLFWTVVVVAVMLEVWDEYQALRWRKPLYVALYPINAEQRPEVDDYIATLREQDFIALEDFFSSEAKRYGLSILRPIEVRLGPRIDAVPPPPPDVNSKLLDIMRWSLKFRWYGWQHQPSVGVPVDIKMYLLYYDVSTHQHLMHSTALQKGRLGRVNLFAERNNHQVNLVVVAHELLHTLRATDKYHMQTNQPIFPQGFVEPYAQPLYPQTMAEIMAGKIPESEQSSHMATDLGETLIGRLTAREIGWLK